MKAIHAYIREHLAEHVIAELQAAGCQKLSVLEVRGISTDVAEEATMPSATLGQRVERVLKLEIVGSDDDVATWANVIVAAGRTGRAGDGLVAILPVLETFAVRAATAAKRI